MKFSLALTKFFQKQPLWLRIVWSLWLVVGSMVITIFLGHSVYLVIPPSTHPWAASYRLALTIGSVCFFSSVTFKEFYDFLFLIPPKYFIPEFLFKLAKTAESTLSAVAFLGLLPLFIFGKFFRDNGLDPLALIGAIAGAVFIVRLIYPYTLTHGTINLEPLQENPNFRQVIDKIKEATVKRRPFSAIRIAIHEFDLDYRRAEALSHEICYADEVKL